jgi:predicted lipoprotein with Yx(FWY)xxD motif
MHKTIRLTAVGLALAAILGACSSSGGSTAPSAAAPSVAPSAAASAAPSTEASAAPSAATSEAPSAAPSAAAISLALADTAKGKVIVDGAGRTLYLFTPDEDAKKPTCYDSCAGAWPAFVSPLGTPTVGEGLDASKVTIVTRDDGQKQVQYGNYPLYYFSGDAKAGDINGEGLNGKWFVVSADGEEIK